MSNNSSPLEPDPFDEHEFAAWRGLLRLQATITRELDRRLAAAHELPVADYGVLITLVGAPERKLRMGDLAARRLVTPSGITRIVTKLEREGLVAREVDPADGRSFYTRLTRKGLKRLRDAQRTHHAIVREHYLSRLTDADRAQLAELFEKALPGVVSSEVWPPATPQPTINPRPRPEHKQEPGRDERQPSKSPPP